MGTVAFPQGLGYIVPECAGALSERSKALSERLAALDRSSRSARSPRSTIYPCPMLSWSRVRPERAGEAAWSTV
eukprot:1913006-Pyramimonas_sp.AAC.1